MFLEDLLEDYTRTRRSHGYSENTLIRVNQTVKMIARDMDVYTLEQFTTELLLEYGDARRSKGLSNSGLYAIYNSVKSFLRFLEDSDIKHPVNRKLIRCKPDYRRKKTLRPWEITKIIKCSPYEIGVLIRVIYTGGLRISEAICIRPADIQSDNTIIVQGKWLTDEPVYLTPQVVSELKWLSKDPTDWCFKGNNRQPEEHIDRKMAYWFIKRAMEKAGFPDNSPHDLRHSFCTELLRKDVSTMKVMILMRHKNISTTQKYTHLLGEDAHSAHTLLPLV